MDTWSEVGLTEMVRYMYDDCMANVFQKYLEDTCIRQFNEIERLKEQLKGEECLVEALEMELEAGQMNVLAVNIQAAEAEFRYEEKAHECLMRKMAGSYAVPIRRLSW